MSEIASFLQDPTSHHIIKKQYVLRDKSGEPIEEPLAVFSRVGREIAQAETDPALRHAYAEKFTDIHLRGAFCAGGRVLAGAGTPHGNILNCYTQGATSNRPSSFLGVMELALKLALVTKVGGGNGVNLDELGDSSEEFRYNTSKPVTKGPFFVAMGSSHRDIKAFIKGEMTDVTKDGNPRVIRPLKRLQRVVYGGLTPELLQLCVENNVMTVIDRDALPCDSAQEFTVEDSVVSIIDIAGKCAWNALRGIPFCVDVTQLRAENSYINGSGGTSSGPYSFVYEVFDNFVHWAVLGGLAAGPVATLRYIYAPVLRAIRQGGTRRGAGMGTLRVFNPHVLDFLTAKDRDREEAEGEITTFNMSVLITDEFVEMVKRDECLKHPIYPVPGKYRRVYMETSYHGGNLETAYEPGVIPIFHEGVPARWLWQEIARHAWAHGEPGVIFVDRINEMSALRELAKENPFYCIDKTNPCVTADTWIQTSKGPRQVSDLIGVPFEATVDGQPYSATGFWKTGDKPVLKVATKRGYTLRLTENHQVLVERSRKRRYGGGYNIDQIWLEAGKLQPGDRLVLSNHRGNAWPGDGTFETGWLVGQMVGDGGYNPEKYSGYVRFWGASQEDLAEYSRDIIRSTEKVRSDFGSCDSEDTTRTTVKSPVLDRLAEGLIEPQTKRILPKLEQMGSAFCCGFIRGFFDADGTVLTSGEKGRSVRLNQSDLEKLQVVQRMLSRLGIASTLYQERRPAGEKTLPDGHGGSGIYPVQANHELCISRDNLVEFANLIGFRDHAKSAALEGALTTLRREVYSETFTAEVETLTEDGFEPVYDCTVEEIHAFDANGLIVHNCGEVPLVTGESCDLGALNWAYYVNDKGEVDWIQMEQDTHTAIRFLDNVLDVNRFAVQDNADVAAAHRRLGLGLMGLADALIKLGKAYDSPEGRDAAREIARCQAQWAREASEKLGQERGIFPLMQARPEMFEGITPRRNVAFLTAAPTGTTSMALAVSSGIEPIYSLVTYRRIGGETRTIIHPLFRERLEQSEPTLSYALQGVSDAKATWNWDKLLADLERHGGSIQKLDMPESFKQVFKTALDIAPEDHVKMQATVQNTFDTVSNLGANSMSKTINMPESATVEEVEQAYMLAYELGCKGCTVYRNNSRQYQVLNTSKAEAQPQDNQSAPRELDPKDCPNCHGKDLKSVMEFGLYAGRKEAEAEGRKPRERPTRLFGLTERIDTEDGKLYVTVNYDEQGPREVVATLGKGGGVLGALSEALGRVISVGLQYGVPFDEYIKKLRGIRGGDGLGFGPKRVLSIPDGVGKVLAAVPPNIMVTPITDTPDDIEADVPVPQPVEVPVAGFQVELDPIEDLGKSPQCPECGARLVFQEGCQKCPVCFTSKCG